MFSPSGHNLPEHLAYSNEHQSISHPYSGPGTSHRGLISLSDSNAHEPNSFQDDLQTFLEPFHQYADNLDALVPLPESYSGFAEPLNTPTPGEYDLYHNYLVNQHLQQVPYQQFPHNDQASINWHQPSLVHTSSQDYGSTQEISPFSSDPTSTPSSSKKPSKESSQSSTKKGSWKQYFRKNIQRVYDVYSHRTKVPKEPTRAYLSAKGTIETARMLLSEDPEKIDAAIEELGTPTQQKRQGTRKTLLGDRSDEVTRQFQKYYGLTYQQSKQLLNRRLNPEKAKLLLNPETFEEGAMILKPDPKKASFRSTVRSTVQQTPTSSFSDSNLASYNAYNDIPTSSLGLMGETYSSTGRTGEAPPAKMKSKIADTEHQMSNLNVAETYEDHFFRLYSHKDRLKMKKLYAQHNKCHIQTAHERLVRAVAEEPKLATELLSGDKERELAALDKIEKPFVRSPRIVRPKLLSTEQRRQVEQSVMTTRWVSLAQAQRIIRKTLTPEIANEIKDPSRYNAAIEKITRTVISRQSFKKPDLQS